MDLTTREGRQEFYHSKDWKELRLYKLSIEPFCKKCEINGKLVPATVVDHIIDMNIDPEKCLDINNLQSLCVNCHNRKTGSTYGNKKMIEGKNKNKIDIKRVWKI